MMNTQDFLDNLKIGDEVTLSSPPMIKTNYIGTVVRRTKTQIVVEYNGKEYKFTTNGSLKSKERWVFMSILNIPASETLVEQEIEGDRIKVLDFLHSISKDLNIINNEDFLKLLELSKKYL